MSNRLLKKKMIDSYPSNNPGTGQGIGGGGVGIGAPTVTSGFANMPPKMQGGVGAPAPFNVGATNPLAAPAMNQSINANTMSGSGGAGGDASMKMNSAAPSAFQGANAGTGGAAAGASTSSTAGVMEKEATVAELTQEEWSKIESLTSLELGEISGDS